MAVYAYHNMPLTTGCARGLIVALFAGNPGYTKRSEIIDTLTEYHTENGGKVLSKAQTVSAIKTALRDLEAQGQAAKHPSSSGYWRVKT